VKRAYRHGISMLASAGHMAVADAGLCADCRLCVDNGPFAALGLDHDQANVDWATCMGYGVCVSHCPRETLSLMRDPAKGEPLEIQELIAHAVPATHEIADR
jgi:heterodisulfide reductase subunit A-like polyferredoxin